MDYTHFKLLLHTMFFRAFEIERQSFSMDYMEWNFQSSVRLRSAMIMNESDEARPRHCDKQQGQDPSHHRPLLRHREADCWLIQLQDPGCLRRAPVREEAPEGSTCRGIVIISWVLFERSKSAPGEKRAKTTRPKSRRREQGTEVKLCPLRLNTTEDALKEAQFNSAANGPAAHAEQSTQQRKQRRA